MSLIIKIILILTMIYCLMYFPLFVGVLYLVLVLLCITLCPSSFAIILKRKRKLVAVIIVKQMYCYYKCAVAIPHGAVDWSAACDCGIS